MTKEKSSWLPVVCWYVMIVAVVLLFVVVLVQPVRADYTETFTSQNATSIPNFSFVTPGSSNYGHSYLINVSLLTVNITDSMLCSSDPYSCINTSGIVGWWHFDNNLTDISGQNNNGAWTGNNSNNYTQGKYNNAGNFTTSNASYVIIGDKAVFDFGTGNFSIFYISINSSNADEMIAKAGTGFTGWLIADNGAGKLQFQITNTTKSSTIYSSSTYKDNNIHFVIAGRDGNNLFIETEKEPRTTAPVTITGNINSAGKKLMIGHRDVATDANFSNVYDEVIIFNRSVSSSEFLNMTKNKLQNLQLSNTANGTYSLTWNSSLDNSLIIPSNFNNHITGLTYLLPENTTINGVTIYNYKNTSHWNTTIFTKLLWESTDWINNSYRNQNYSLITSNGEPFENAVSELRYGIVYKNNISYIFYLAVDHSIYGITYNHLNRTYSSPIFIAYSNTDNHGSPSVVIDSTGLIHIIFGGHVSSTPIYHIKSVYPYNISNWTTKNNIISSCTGVLYNCEYGTAAIDQNDKIWVIYKTTASGGVATNGINLTTSVDGGSTWNNSIRLINSSTITNCLYPSCAYPTWWVYSSKLSIDTTGNMSFLYNYYNLSNTSKWTYIGYMKHTYGDADNVWKMSNNTPYILPANETYGDIIDNGTNVGFGSSDIYTDTINKTLAIWRNSTTNTLHVKSLNSSNLWTDISPSLNNHTGNIESRIFTVNGIIYIYTQLGNTTTQDINMLKSIDSGLTYNINTIISNIGNSSVRTTFTSGLIYNNNIDISWSNSGRIYFVTHGEKIRSELRTTTIYLNINNSIDSASSNAVSYDVNDILTLIPINLVIAPTSSSVNIYSQTWNTAGDYHKTILVSSDVPDNPTQFVVGDNPPYTNMYVTKDGTHWYLYPSNSTGYIYFTSNGNGQFDITTTQQLLVKYYNTQNETNSVIFLLFPLIIIAIIYFVISQLGIDLELGRFNIMYLLILLVAAFVIISLAGMF